MFFDMKICIMFTFLGYYCHVFTLYTRKNEHNKLLIKYIFICKINSNIHQSFNKIM